jgi:hypothetical protein
MSRIFLAGAAGAIGRRLTPGVFNIADPNDEVSTVKARAELGWRADFRMD